MLRHIFELAGEVVANIVVFALALALSTGLSCNPKVQCDDRDQAAKVATP